MEIIPDNVKRISIINRPIAVPYNYRISYKVCQLLLIMTRCSRNTACSLEKLQIISHVFTSEDALNDLLSFLNDKKALIIRFDPVINRVISFALAEQLIMQQVNNKYKLTTIGKSFVELIEKDTELLKEEKEILLKISTKLTDKKIDKLIKMWV